MFDDFGMGNAMDDLLASFGIYTYDGNIDLGGGVNIDLEPQESTLTLNAPTELGVISLEFNLEDINLPKFKFTTEDFIMTGNITSQTLYGTVFIDYGGGHSGQLNESVSGNRNFSISTGVSVSF